MTVRGVILASASPRRNELLRQLLDGFEVVIGGIDEDSDDPVEELAGRLAIAKAQHVANAQRDAVVLGADTVVALGDTAFGKPADGADAVSMLRILRGRAHSVYTAIAVVVDDQCFHETSVSQVGMAPLSDDAILAYVASGRPLDKAGAYAIQDTDVPTVAKLEGCYCGVMGLPLWLTRRLLKEAGIESCEPPLARCRDCPERQPRRD